MDGKEGQKRYCLSAVSLWLTAMLCLITWVSKTQWLYSFHKNHSNIGSMKIKGFFIKSYWTQYLRLKLNHKAWTCAASSKGVQNSIKKCWQCFSKAHGEAWIWRMWERPFCYLCYRPVLSDIESLMFIWVLSCIHLRHILHSEAILLSISSLTPKWTLCF